MSQNKYTNQADFSPIAQGDWFPEYTMNISVSPNIDLTDATYCMVMKQSANSPTVVRDFMPVLDTLVNPQNAIVTIPGFNADYPVYNYVYGIRLILANGRKVYYLTGSIDIYTTIPNRCQ